MTDLVRFIAEKLGIHWLDGFHLFLISLVLVLIFLLYKRFQTKLLQDLEAVVKELRAGMRKIEAIHQSDSTESGESLLTRQQCFQAVRKVSESSRGLFQKQEELEKKIEEASQIICKHCGSTACPMLSQFSAFSEEIKTMFNEWTAEARASRNETLHLIEKIYDRINDFINKIMARLLAALENAMVGKTERSSEREDRHDSN